jgi:hypothetical protein
MRICEDSMLRFSLAVMLVSAASLPPLAVPAAWAQTPSSRPSPADAGAAVPPLVFQSPFARYQAFVEQQVGSWKETNDAVGRIGGWRVYAREAREPESGSAAQPATAKPVPGGPTRPAPGSHGDHRMQHGGKHE